MPTGPRSINVALPSPRAPRDRPNDDRASIHIELSEDEAFGEIAPNLALDDIFDREETQRIQDAFAKATGVASLITYPDGRPFTRPSNFSRLCSTIIRQSEKGACNCMKSNAAIGKGNPDGPIIQPCLSGGLVDAGASIMIGDRHVGNWLIGQVVSGPLDVDQMMRYAREIGADEKEYRQALDEVTRMPAKQFEQIGDALFLIARQLSNIGLKNLQLARHVAKLHATEKQLQRLALYDVLTELPNRALGYDRLRLALEQSRRNGLGVAVLFIDIDQFKQVNDTRGHSVGDALLQDAAARLQSCCRASDTVARLGGDEFMMVLPELACSDGAESVAKQIVRCMAEPFSVGGVRHFVSASVGIALCPDDGKDSERLLQCADTAMYHTKEAGRNGYRRFNTAMGTQAVQRASVENELHQALERNELELHFQPIYPIGQAMPVGAEALLRWYPPGVDGYPPAKLIAHSEDTGLIVPIGTWVLERACGAAMRWPRLSEPSLVVSVNISHGQLVEPDFCEHVADILERTGLAPQRLHLEITANAIAELGNIELLGRLSALGVSIAIDDFGTGNTALGRLKHLPIDILKIDRSLIDDLPGTFADRAMVAAMISMGQGLGMQVVGKGVETTEQQDCLRANGCDLIQGHLLSPPLSELAFQEYLRTQTIRERDRDRVDMDPTTVQTTIARRHMPAPRPVRAADETRESKGASG